MQTGVITVFELASFVLYMNGNTRNLVSRWLWCGAFLLLLLTTSCNLPQATPTSIGTILPTGGAPTDSIPTAMQSGIAPTALIPVTGDEPVTLQCQFCVNDEPHALLIVPEAASYYTSDTSDRITCLTIQVTNGRRILLCRGSQQASFNFNVCYGDSNCLQYPVTLDPCPVNPTGGAVNSPTPAVLTPINTLAAVTAPADTLAPSATATVTPTSIAPPPLATTMVPPVAATTVAPPPAVTTVAPPHTQPTRRSTQQVATPQQGVTSQPGVGIQDPGEFVRWYFGAVWQIRNYQDLWDNYLTESFKTRVSSSSYPEYVQWWSSVERVDVNSVQVMQNDGTHAWVHVNVTFTMKDGRVISNQEYDYDLLFDPARQTWMFDYRP